MYTETDLPVAARPFFFLPMQGCEKILEAVESTQDVAFEEVARRLPAGIFEDLVVQPGPSEQDFDEPVMEAGGVGVSHMEVDTYPSPAAGPEFSATPVGQDPVVTRRTVEGEEPYSPDRQPEPQPRDLSPDGPPNPSQRPVQEATPERDRPTMGASARAAGDGGGGPRGAGSGVSA